MDIQNENFRVAVVGAGIAGSATAILLQKQGINVTVFEREKTPKPLGAGIMLQPPGRKVLSFIDTENIVLKHAHPIYSFNGMQHNAEKLLYDIQFRDLGDNMYGVGVQRGALFQTLYNRLLPNGCNVVNGVCIEKINTVAPYNHTLVDTEGNDHTGFNLVIVANGAASKLRDHYNITKKSYRQSVSAVWAKLQVEDDRLKNRILQIYDKRVLLGFMPIGKDPESPEKGEYLNFFWGLNSVDSSITSPKHFTAWKKQVEQLVPEYKNVSDKIEDPSQLMHAPYFDSYIMPMYLKEGIVFIGDCAHAMSPQLSSGTNMALLDAYFLAKSFEHYKNVSEMLYHFNNARKQQISYYKLVSQCVTPMFQSPQNLDFIRDYILPKFIKIPLFHKIMLETLLGIKKGLFSTIDSGYYK